MSVTFEQIILDAKRIANRLKDREALGDALLLESESVNKQIESMRQFQDDIDILNRLARERSNNQLITIIHQENPQIREIQQENRLLKAALEDHQHALEHIMSKYREHTQAKILNTKVNFVEAYSRHHQAADIERRDQLIRQQTAKIQEMAAVMQRASQLDEEKLNHEQEVLSRLVTENKGLRELLEISRKYGSGGQKMLVDEKSTQTEACLLEELIEAAIKERATATTSSSSSSSSKATEKPTTDMTPADAKVPATEQHSSASVVSEGAPTTVTTSTSSSTNTGTIKAMPSVVNSTAEPTTASTIAAAATVATTAITVAGTVPATTTTSSS
ncbi:FGFR1 oncogene partner 2 homolog [Anopheles aquasalis]|uniref:FGFR1 oncogene partner 2 homolog n=1 Tax=Anopheles aquasalis TaxID=42839 RepID=UPI00215A3C98|nr:FGFR1 oncogene partner 2 homolog [Anopheles aquasalis]XP_050095480.1 FGFR1 oncogene partner 2 homolog [Anopheles aquasalis]